MENKTYMTAAQADAFMTENPFGYTFGSAKTDMGEEPAYVYVDGGVKYLVIRDEWDYPAIFAFGISSDGVSTKKSPLYEGQAALDFVTAHEWFPVIKTYTNKEDAEAAYAEF